MPYQEIIMKTDLERCIDELEESNSHAENAIINLEKYIDGARKDSEHIERLKGYLAYLKQAQKDLEFVGIDIWNEK